MKNIDRDEPGWPTELSLLQTENRPVEAIIVLASLKEVRLVIPELPYRADRAGFALIEIPAVAGEGVTWSRALCSPHQAVIRLRELAAYIEKNTTR